MSSLPKKEHHDGDYPATSSHVQVVEVVEMGDTEKPNEIQKSSGDEISRGSGFQTEGKEKKLRKTQYDKGERDRKVSKYQSKKKVKLESSSFSAEDTLPKIKTEALTEDMVASVECKTESTTCDSNPLSNKIQMVCPLPVKHESEGMPNDCSSDAKHSRASPMDWDDDLEAELLYGDGEDCFGLSVAEDGNDDDWLVENYGDMKTRDRHRDYEEISNESGNEDFADSEEDAERERKKSVGSSSEGSVKSTKPGSQMSEDSSEGKQAGHAPFMPSDEEASGRRETGVSFTPDRKTKTFKPEPITAPGTSESHVQSKSASPIKASTGAKGGDKTDIVASSFPQKLKAHARNSSPKTSKMNTISKAASSIGSSVKSMDLVISTKQTSNSAAKVSASKASELKKSFSDTAVNTRQPSVSTLNKNASKTLSTKMDRKSPLLSASGSPEVGVRRTVVSSAKDKKETNKRSPILSGRSPKKGAKSANAAASESSKSFKSVAPPEDSPVSPEITFSHTSSSVVSKLDGSLSEREIFPGIQTSFHFGLSSHTGTEWNMEGMAEVSADEGDEDSDVLSLYEYDTFLESKEEAEERGRGPALSKRTVSCSTKKSKDGESDPYLMPGGNLSISVSDKLERRVSRPSSNERYENERPDVALKDSKKNAETEREKTEKRGVQSVQKPQAKERQSPRPDSRGEARAMNDHKFQKPKLPAPKFDRRVNQASSKPCPRPVQSVSYERPAKVSQGRQAGKCPQVKGGLGGKQQAPGEFQKTRAVPSFQRTLQHPLEQTRLQKELESELKHFLEKKNIFEAMETVGKIHANEAMKIERGLVLNLLHLLIREGAVPQLMKIFTFVCNQGLFISEVCNAYIRLGCGEGSRYDRQLKNIFQFLRRHSTQPAGDCIISLLSFYSEHKGDPMMFWLMLSYFDTFPGFMVPVPMLERAITKLLQHKDRDAISKFNQWMLTTRKESVLQKLDLGLIGQMAASMLPASLARVQKIITGALEENKDDDLKKDLMAPVDTTLDLPSNFSDQDYLFYSNRIQECGTRKDLDRLVQVYVELCRRARFNRRLLKDYVQALLLLPPLQKMSVVADVDGFLHRLYTAVQQERSQGTPVEPDELALAHLSALLLDHSYFNHPADMTLDLLDVITQCPLVVKKLLINCGDIGYNMITVCLKCQQPLRAFELLKVLRLRKNDEQGTSQVKELLRQLVAVGDIPSVVTVVKVAEAQQAMGIADIGILASQLMWHLLNTGNIRVALELLDLAQKPSTPPPLPTALLRALLVACHLSGYSDKASAFFEEMKIRRVYNGQAFRTRPYVFQVSTMLTPAEIRLCILDRLKELHHKLCNQMKLGGQLGQLDKDLGVKLVYEHDPQLLALPFLALAPRSMEQAIAVVTQELAKMSPPLQATFDEQIQLLVLEPSSLVTHLRSYQSPGLKQGLVWEDESPQGSPPAVPRLPLPSSLGPESGAGRPLPASPPPVHSSGLQHFTGRQLPASPPPVHSSGLQHFTRRQLPASPPPVHSSGLQHFTRRQLPASPPPVHSSGLQHFTGRQLPAGPPKPMMLGEMRVPASQSFPKPVGPDDGQMPAYGGPVLPFAKHQKRDGHQLPVSPSAMEEGVILESRHATHLPSRLAETVGRELLEPSHVAQSSVQWMESAGVPLPGPSDMARPPYQPVEPFQSRNSTEKQFPKQQNVTRAMYWQLDDDQNQASKSADVPLPSQRPVNSRGRQLPAPSFPRSRSSLQMKRRLSTPPEHQPAEQCPAFKTPLLPTPQFHPDEQPGMPHDPLKELPPKKLKMSPPPDQHLAAGRRHTLENNLTSQFRQQHSSPVPEIPQPLASRDKWQLRQPTRGRGMRQQSDRDPSQFHDYFSQNPERQCIPSSRDSDQMPPYSVQGGRRPVQNSQGMGQPLQQIPPDDIMKHLPQQAAQGNRPFVQQAEESLGQQYYEERPRAIERQFRKEPRGLPQLSTQQTNLHRSQQTTRGMNRSQQQFTGDGDMLPIVPPRFEEQGWNPSVQMGTQSKMVTQEMNPDVMDDGWQDRPSRYGRQHRGTLPYGDAPLYEEREEYSWQNQSPTEVQSFDPTERSAEGFSVLETATEHPRHQASFHKPVGYPPGGVRGSARGRDRMAFGSRSPWKASTRGRGFRGSFTQV